MRTLGTDWAVAWIQESASSVTEHRMELIDLDRAIGDGDHGENLTRGFTAAVEKLQSSDLQDPGSVFKLVAMTLMSTVGGAAGPLYGSAFLGAAKSAPAELDGDAVATLVEEALAAIMKRGKATAGEKTMIDAWTPAAQAARVAAGQGAEPVDVFDAAATAAAAGAEATEPLIATKGRASYLGERSRGHRDPGSQSTAYILAAAVRAARLTPVVDAGMA